MSAKSVIRGDEATIKQQVQDWTNGLKNIGFNEVSRNNNKIQFSKNDVFASIEFTDSEAKINVNHKKEAKFKYVAKIQSEYLKITKRMKHAKLN